MIDYLWQDIRIAARSLRRTPGFTVAAVLTLALGIGANTAIFSVVNGILLRPLPYPDADRLVSVWSAWADTPRARISPGEYFDYLDRAGAFAHFGVYATGFESIVGAGEPERLRSGYVSPGVLAALGVEPRLGRRFTDDEFSGRDGVPDAPVILITDGLWRRQFGAAEDVVGRQVLLDNRNRTIVGVLPPEFRLPDEFDSPLPVDLLAPLGLDRRAAPYGSHFLAGVARLADGVSADQATARLRAVADEIARAVPDNYPKAMRFTAGASSLREAVVGDVRGTLLVLLAAVALVLLIACGNITHLFLSRGERRRDEFAIRVALGAGHGRLVRQTLVETTLVAALGGALAIALAVVATRGLVAISPPDLPRLDTIGVDRRVLLFAVGASLAVGLLVGLAPALRNALGMRAAAGVVSGRGAVSASAPRQRLRRLLVGSEVALAIVLTFGAGLLANSFIRLLSVNPGYQTEGVLTAALSLPDSTYDDARTTTFVATLLERLHAQQGVVAAGAVNGLPLAGSLGDLNFQIEGREVPPGQRSPRLDWQVVTPGYFESMGIRVVNGRDLAITDRTDAPGVVLVNQAAAKLYWPDGDAIGRRIKLGAGAGPGWVTIVGVVNDVRQASLREPPRPEMYLAHTQFRFWGGGGPVRTLTLVLKANTDPAALAGTLRREVAELDPALPIAVVRTMNAVRSASVSSLRFVTLLLSLFAGVAVLVTVVGVYGVVTYAVSQRRREMGVRIALGAAPRMVIGLVLRQGLTPVALGIAGGIAGGLVLSGALRAQLYGVTPYDPQTASLVCAVVGAAALIACYLPARRVSRTDPATTLRDE